MFSGKGGVGKTTCAAASAIHYASIGKRTLVLSTDATPSLSHIYEMRNAAGPAEVVNGLRFAELGIRQVQEMWDRRFGREVYQVFSAFVEIDYATFVEFMTSVLPGLGEEFMVDYIRETALSGEYDVIVWDTAPLGQTLALLKTPGLLADHLRMAPRIYARLRLGRESREPVLDILRRWQRLSEENMRFLREEVQFVLVTIPEALAVQQLDNVFGELAGHSINVRRMIVNNVVKNTDSEFLARKADQQRKYLALLRGRYSQLPIVELQAFPYELKGIDRLREIAALLSVTGTPKAL
jgi:arsenite-transporting ATPase